MGVFGEDQDAVHVEDHATGCHEGLFAGIGRRVNRWGWAPVYFRSGAKIERGRMTRSEEHRLIRRAAGGDRGAADAFIRAHQASLYAYMLRLSGRPDVAEDVVQEAFVRVLTNLHRFDYRYRFSTWLFTIAKRLYVNLCQRHKPSYDTDAVGNFRASTVGPEGRVEDREVASNTRDALQSSLMELSAEQREILILFHQLDWPIALIAAHMDMPEGTVKSHLHRGRRRLRDLLERDEVYSRHVGEVWT